MLNHTGPDGDVNSLGNNPGNLNLEQNAQAGTADATANNAGSEHSGGLGAAEHVVGGFNDIQNDIGNSLFGNHPTTTSVKSDPAGFLPNQGRPNCGPSFGSNNFTSFGLFNNFEPTSGSKAVKAHSYQGDAKNSYTSSFAAPRSSGTVPFARDPRYGPKKLNTNTMVPNAFSNEIPRVVSENQPEQMSRTETFGTPQNGTERQNDTDPIVTIIGVFEGGIKEVSTGVSQVQSMAYDLHEQLANGIKSLANGMTIGMDRLSEKMDQSVQIWNAKLSTIEQNQTDQAHFHDQQVEDLKNQVGTLKQLVDNTTLINESTQHARAGNVEHSQTSSRLDQPDKSNASSIAFRLDTEKATKMSNPALLSTRNKTYQKGTGDHEGQLPRTSREVGFATPNLTSTPSQLPPNSGPPNSGPHFQGEGRSLDQNRERSVRDHNGHNQHSWPSYHDNRRDQNYDSNRYDDLMAEKDRKFQDQELLKRTYRLAEHSNSLPTFDAGAETIGYFLVGRLLFYLEDQNLSANMKYIEPWLTKCLPSISPVILRNAKNNAKKGLQDTQVKTFLVRFARMIHGKGKPVSKLGLARHPLETVQAYCMRLLIEFETIIYHRHDEERTERELVSQVTYHLSCSNDHTVKTFMAQAQMILNLDTIDSIDSLDRIAQNADKCIIPTSDYHNVSAIETRPEVAATHGINQTLRSNPYDPPSGRGPTTKECTECKKKFTPEQQSHFKCRGCFVTKFRNENTTNNRENSKKDCTSCGKTFSGEQHHRSCRDCFAERRGRSMEKGNGNRGGHYRSQSRGSQQRPQSQNYRSKSRDTGSKWDYNPDVKAANATDEYDAPQTSCCISAPIVGAECEIPNESLTPDNIAAALETFGVREPIRSPAHHRVFLRFIHKDSGEKGMILVDSGANINTFTKKACHRLGIDITPTKLHAPRVLDFQGKPCTTEGTVNTALQIGKAEYEGTFTVTEASFGPDVILGTPFLSKYGLTELLREKLAGITGQTQGNIPKN